MVKTSILRLLLPYVSDIGSAAFRRHIVEALPSKGVQRLRDISDIMYERSILIFNEKKAALAKGDDALKHQIGEGRDIMSILRMYPLACRSAVVTHSCNSPGEHDGCGGGQASG